MGDARSDADGWGFSQFLATGKKDSYNVYWDKDNDNVIDQGEMHKVVEMGGSAGKWAYVDFTFGLDEHGNPA